MALRQRRYYPLRRRSLPWVTPVLALALLLSFLITVLVGPEQQTRLFDRFGLQPVEAFGGAQFLLQPQLISALFFHVDLKHLLANAGFLLVFGLPIERQWTGPWVVAVFVISGLVSNLVAAITLAPEVAPLVGASGAVSGVIGAYLVHYPQSRIGVLVPLGLFMQYFKIPAVLIISGWFALQMLYTMLGDALGPVAWWAHVAGFVSGAGMAVLARAVRH